MILLCFQKLLELEENPAELLDLMELLELKDELEELNPALEAEEALYQVGYMKPVALRLEAEELWP